MIAFETMKDNPGFGGEVDATIYTSLPIREYKEKENRASYKELLAGTTEVNFANGEFANSVVKVNIRKDQIKIFPEGVLALYNILTTKKGELKSEYKKLIGKIIIVVDIGGGTIDIAGVEINEKDGIPLLNPVFDLVDFIDAGVMNVTEAIVKELRLDGYEISAAELDLCIRENESILDDGNDVSKRADEGLEGLSQKAYTRVMNNINSLTPAKKRAVKEVFVTGGGALMSGNEKK